MNQPNDKARAAALAYCGPIDHTTKTIDFDKHMTFFAFDKYMTFLAGVEWKSKEQELDSIHTCHDECRRKSCIDFREITKLKAEKEKVEREYIVLREACRCIDLDYEAYWGMAGEALAAADAIRGEK